MKTNLMRRALLAAALILPLGAAQAQAFPEKNRDFRVLCGFPAGSGADILVRFYADKLAAVSGQKVIVENKPGMISALAGETVARSRPDGYTMFITPGSASHAANLYLFKKLPYDPIKDFTPVTTLSKVFFILTVDAKSPYKTVKDLTDAMKKKGDRSSFAYASPTAMASSELYKARAGLNALGIPFKTSGASDPEMQAGKIDFEFVDSVFGIEPLRSGKRRGLAVTSAQRSTVLPDIPTMVEAAGIAEFDISPWWAVFLPANAPKPVVEKLEAWFNQIVAMEETKKFLANTGTESFPGNAKFLADYLPKEIKKWGELMKLAKVEPQ